MLILPPAIAEKYELTECVSFSPAFIGNRTIDFNQLTESDAEYLLSIESPYIVRKTKKAKNKTILPASDEVKKD